MYQAALPFDFSQCQRWHHGRERWRPAGELFNPRYASVQRIDTATAKAFVQEHHYSRSFPASRVNVGLFVKKPFQKEVLAGCATFSVPMTQAVVPALLDGLHPSLGVELGRFVLLDEVEANGETWTLARAFKVLREALPEIRGVVSYCDPEPRYSQTGELVKKGQGTIYRAHNAIPRGRSKPRTLLLAPDGSVANERALSKLRNGESGAEYVEGMLRSMGAEARRLSESGADYVRRLIASGFLRRLRHPGNLAFTWKV
jgi:hypothetical protein